MRKKILFINDLVAGGGAEQVMRYIIDYLLKQEKFDISVHANDLHNEFYGLFPYKVHYLPALWAPSFAFRSNFKLLVSFFLWLRKSRLFTYIIKKYILEKYDIVVAMKEGFPTKLAASINGATKIGWVHIDYNYVYSKKGCYVSKDDELFYMKQMDHVVCVSHAVKEAICEVVGDPGNLRVLYNPVNYVNILERSLEESHLKKPEDRLLLVAVGRLAVEKGYDRLLEALYLLDEKDKYELWIIGEGPCKEWLLKVKEDFSLIHVHFLGHQSNPYKFVKQADWFISVSFFESFGIAIQEALILNVPVIATECSAIREVFNPEFGVLVDNSIDGIKCGLHEVLSNPAIHTTSKNSILAKFNKNLFEARLQSICNLF